MKTRKFMVALLSVIICFVSARSYAQDVIVKNDLETLTVYNVDVSSTFVYYQESPDAGAPTLKMPVSDVMIIKKADGTKIDPLAVTTQAAAIEQKPSRSRILVPQEPRDYVTAVVSSPIKQKEDGRHFKAVTPDGIELKYRVLSEEEHTLEVIGKVSSKQVDAIIIPEDVEIDGIVYTVTRIGERAFSRCLFKDCQFPLTLKSVGNSAFNMSDLRRVQLPEGVTEIGSSAFKSIGKDYYTIEKHKVEYLYIPTTVTHIGIDAFKFAGNKNSPRGYYEGRLDCLPEFVTSKNCTNYGIDHNAIEEYEKRWKGESE